MPWNSLVADLVHSAAHCGSGPVSGGYASPVAERHRRIDHGMQPLNDSTGPCKALALFPAFSTAQQALAAHEDQVTAAVALLAAGGGRVVVWILSVAEKYTQMYDRIFGGAAGGTWPLIPPSPGRTIP